jgi:ketosteroid isomerase-like protein
MADHVELPESAVSDQTIPSRMPCSLTNLHDSFPVSLCPLPAESMAVDRPSGLAEKNAIRASTWRRKAKVMQAPREWPEQMTAAGAAMQNGDPDPVINSWADSDEITLFGAWGPIEKGHKAVTDTMRWVGSRFTGADVVDVGACRRRLQRRPAYTVGFERTHVSVDGGPMRDMVIRASHIYRRIDGDWKLVHRHADFPPPDQRTTSARATMAPAREAS